MHDVATLLPDRFVVPLDGSDFALRAVAFADAWATDFGADIELVTTPHTVDPTARKVPPPWLAEAAQGLHASTVRTRYVDVNDPVSAIVDVTNERPSACLCMATHGHGPIVGAALGHVAEQVVRELQVPAMLLGPQCDAWHDGPVLVCHDGSRAAGAIVPLASAWAGALGVPVVLVHAMHPLDVETARATPPEVTRAAVRLGTKPLLDRDRSPAAALLDTIADVKPSIVALTTHGRSGVARLALGSVATRLIHFSPCPALVVRPSVSDLEEG